MTEPLKRAPWLIALLAALASLAVYTRLPAQLTTHWSMDGVPNGWMSRPVGALFTPAMILVVGTIMRYAPRIDPRRENYEKFGAAYEITGIAVLLLLLVIHLLVLAVGVGYHPPLERIVPMLVGALLVVMGNVLPRARSNWFYGIRTPWTLSSDRIWVRTHRLGGYIMILAGFVVIAASALLPLRASLAVVIAASLVAAIVPAIYSYLIWKQDAKS